MRPPRKPALGGFPRGAQRNSAPYTLFDQRSNPQPPPSSKWQSDVAHWQAGGLGHSTHFNVTTTAMAPRQLLSQPHCRDGPGARSWAECGAAAHARCVAPTLDHFGANSGQKRPGIRPASLGHGAPRERQRHRSVRRTKTAYFSHCECIIHVFSPQLNTVFTVFSVIHCIH